MFGALFCSLCLYDISYATWEIWDTDFVTPTGTGIKIRGCVGEGVIIQARLLGQELTQSESAPSTWQDFKVWLSDKQEGQSPTTDAGEEPGLAFMFMSTNGIWQATPFLIKYLFVLPELVCMDSIGCSYGKEKSHFPIVNCIKIILFTTVNKVVQSSLEPPYCITDLFTTLTAQRHSAFSPLPSSFYTSMRTHTHIHTPSMDSGKHKDGDELMS